MLTYSSVILLADTFAYLIIWLLFLFWGFITRQKLFLSLKFVTIELRNLDISLVSLYFLYNSLEK